MPGGLRCSVEENGEQLTFRELFERMNNCQEFSDQYSEALAGIPFEAYFWEHPPLNTERLDDEAEFVLVESTTLAGVRPDPMPFSDKFAEAGGKDVIAFDNLGGDARLVVPVPVGPLEAYPHLAAFLRRAPRTQVRSLWKAVAESLKDTLCDRPKWLSTAGLGVYWLHLRIDSRPKYYRHAPYKLAE